MSLNFYIAIGLVLALLLSPLLLVTAPLWVSWILWQRRQQRREGLRYLWPFMARTIANYAQAMIPADPPEIPWAEAPAPANKMRCSFIDWPLIRSPQKAPATTTPAVPCMSSLKVHSWSRKRFSCKIALPFRKSSHCRRASG